MNSRSASEPFFISMVTELNIEPHHHKPHNIPEIYILKWLLSERQIRRKSTLLSTFLCPSSIFSRDLAQETGTIERHPAAIGAFARFGSDAAAYLGDHL